MGHRDVLRDCAESVKQSRLGVLGGFVDNVVEKERRGERWCSLFSIGAPLSCVQGGRGHFFSEGQRVSSCRYSMAQRFWSGATCMFYTLLHRLGCTVHWLPGGHQSHYSHLNGVASPVRGCQVSGCPRRLCSGGSRLVSVVHG